MAGGHGGSRPGSGRKSKRVRFPKESQSVDEKLAAQLDKSVRNLIKLANGGYMRKTRVMKMAGTITKPAFEVVTGPRGGKTVIRKEVPALPDLAYETLVCVEERLEYADPDRAANEYIVDRIMGRPTTAEDEEETKDKVEPNDEARKAAMEKTKEWRQQSQNQLSSIRNPLTGSTEWDSASTNDSTSSPDSETMEEF